jgi:hypothetical protein
MTLIDPDGRQIRVNTGSGSEWSATDFASYTNIKGVEAINGVLTFNGDFSKLKENEKEIVRTINGNTIVENGGINYKLIINAVVLQGDSYINEEGQKCNVPGDSYGKITYNEDGTAIATVYISIDVIKDMKSGNVINSEEDVVQHGLNEAITGAKEKCTSWECAHAATVDKYGFNWSGSVNQGECKGLYYDDPNKLYGIFHKDGYDHKELIHDYNPPK